MSGSKHHILPRFLLKGFASKVVPKASRQDDVFVWVYRKGGKHYESKTTNVGFETDFYGKDGELNVDDEITALESDFAHSIDQLRGQQDGYRIADEKVIEFITHLTARTKHLRDSIIDASGFFADNVFGYFSDYPNWKAWCIEHYKRHPEVIKNALDEAIPKLPFPAHQKLMIRQYIERMPVEQIVEQMDNQQAGYEFLFQSLRLKLKAGMQDIVKQGHIKALLKDLVSEPRLERYKKLNWYVRKPTEPLILGDVGCIFELDGESNFKSIGGAEEEIENIYLPISTDNIVVGTSFPDPPDIDSAIINEAIAKCSRDYFVCSVDLPEMGNLASLLGETKMISDEELGQSIRDLIDEP